MEIIDSRENLIRLINQYQNLVFSICLKITGDYFTAEDIIEYKRFRNRVITSVAAIIILTTFSSNWFKISYAEIDKLETTNNKIFTYFDNSHYISDLLNGKEE